MELDISKLSDLLNANAYLKQSCDKIFVYKNVKCVIEFPVLMGQVALDVELVENSLVASLVGRTIATRRLIRNAFLTKYQLRQKDGERLLIPGSLSDGNTETLIENRLFRIQGVNAI